MVLFDKQHNIIHGMGFFVVVRLGAYGCRCSMPYVCRLVCDRLLIVINNSIECNIFAFRDLTDFVFRPNMPRFPTFDKCCDILYSLTVFAITIAFQARSKACLWYYSQRKHLCQEREEKNMIIVRYEKRWALAY